MGRTKTPSNLLILHLWSLMLPCLAQPIRFSHQGNDLVAIVDQSGSMSGTGSKAKNDPYGIRNRMPLDGKRSLGCDRVILATDEGPELIFEWDAAGFFRERPLSFPIAPNRRAKDESKRDNNRLQEKIRGSPIFHDLSVQGQNHQPEHPFEGSVFTFFVETLDQTHCTGYEIKPQIRLRLDDRLTNRTLAESEPIKMTTEEAKPISWTWTTGLNDAGSRAFVFEIDPVPVVRELVETGGKNNPLIFELTLFPMPHDLIIDRVKIEPETLRDGDPAIINVTVRDDARFPGSKLNGVSLDIREKYTEVVFGRADPFVPFSQETVIVTVNLGAGGFGSGYKTMIIIADRKPKIVEFNIDTLVENY